jgi:phosphoribosylanthranilate isomerase
MTLIKFCGMTRDADVDLACELGAGALGFVLWRKSPRSVDLERVRLLLKRVAPGVLRVGVFVAPTPDEIASARDAGIQVAQIHGEPWDVPASGLERWIARSLDDDVNAVPAPLTVVLDAKDPVRYGGTGQTIDWPRAKPIAARRRVMLAGGLTPDNARDAIRTVQPYGVDVASGIEERPGEKSASAMRRFVAAVREAEKE